jgi:hypothetical protein
MDAAAHIVRFPPRRSAVVWLLRACEGGWLVLHGAHGWLHGSRAAALEDARWLADNFGLPIRRAGGCA